MGDDEILHVSRAMKVLVGDTPNGSRGQITIRTKRNKFPQGLIGELHRGAQPADLLINWIRSEARYRELVVKKDVP